jgi:type VI protein secretion system component Hcp
MKKKASKARTRSKVKDLSPRRSSKVKGGDKSGDRVTHSDFVIVKTTDVATPKLF